MKFYFFVFTILAVVLSSPVPAHSQSSGYHLIDSLQLGGEGGWDYLLVDTAAERVYISRGTRVQVVDLTRRSIVGEIPNTNGVHGIALVPDLGRGYTSNGRDSSVTVFDMKTLKTLAVIKIDASNPDAIMFDAFSRRVFTFNGGSSSATAIDVDSNGVAGTVSLSGKPEFAVTDGRGRIYVNIEDKNSIMAFDAKTLKVLNTWPLAPGEGPSGLALDRDHHRLFSVCSNKLMIVVDADSGNVVTTVPIGSGVDASAFDPAAQLVFSSNGEGTLTVVHEDSPVKFSVVDNIVTRRGARTMALDQKTGRVYTVSAKFGPLPAPTPDRPHPRATIEPGSAKLYILGK